MMMTTSARVFEKKVKSSSLFVSHYYFGFQLPHRETVHSDLSLKFSN